MLAAAVKNTSARVCFAWISRPTKADADVGTSYWPSPDSPLPEHALIQTKSEGQPCWRPKENVVVKFC